MDKEVKKVFEGEIEVVPTSTALESLTRGEIDIQIATARKYPRSIEVFQRKIKELAMLDKETAAECKYTLPRGGKKISGPSVRFAEIVAASYGNIRVGARVIAIDDKYIVAQGVAHDLENNYATTEEVRRRITYSDGKRYNDDMIMMTANAACAIARRNATFVIVPKALTKAVYDEVLQLVIGDGKPLKELRQGMLEYWASVGITDKQVFAVLGKKGISDITIQDIDDMRGLQVAIKEGMTTLEDAFTIQSSESKKEKTKTDGSELLKNAKTSVKENETPGEKQQPAKSDKEQYPCNICKQVFNSLDDLAVHKCPGPKEEEPKEKPKTVKQRLIDDLGPIKKNDPEKYKAGLAAFLQRDPTSGELMTELKDWTQRELQGVKNAITTLEEQPEAIQPEQETKPSEADSEANQANSEADADTSEKAEDPERQKYIDNILKAGCGKSSLVKIIKEVVWKNKLPEGMDESKLIQLAENPDLIEDVEHLKSIAQVAQYMPKEKT